MLHLLFCKCIDFMHIVVKKCLHSRKTQKFANVMYSLVLNERVNLNA